MEPLPVAVDPTPPERLPLVRLARGRHGRVAAGHPWVFSNEIEMDAATKALPGGAIVRVVRSTGGVEGTAYFNPRTLIAARFLSRNVDDTVDAAFVTARVRRAAALRDRLFARPFYRLIHAEADGLPGLIVDRYGAVLVVQTNTAGMDRLQPSILSVLIDVFPGSAIALRNDAPSREQEGLGEEVRWAHSEAQLPLRLEEGGAVFFADVLGGQKTGWFYDHRDNRSYIASLSRGASVLDLYCHTGGFAVQCALGGATSVVAVDRAEPALTLAELAATENGVSARCTFQRGEVFEELERLARERRTFDVVIADPPAFVKSKKDLEPGLRGYRKLTRLSATAVTPRGLLLVASCSHNVSMEALIEQVGRGLRDAGREGRIIRAAGAGADHPVHPMLPETAYLKALTIALD